MRTSILKLGMAAGLVLSFLATGAIFSDSEAHRRDRDDDRYRNRVDRILDREHRAYHRDMERRRRAINNQYRYGAYGYRGDTVMDRLGQVVYGNTYDPRLDPRYRGYGSYIPVGLNPPGPPPHAAVWRKNPVWQQSNPWNNTWNSPWNGRRW